jgi:hypothetical protein
MNIFSIFVSYKIIKQIKMKKLLLGLFTLTSGYFYSQVHFQESFESGLPGTWTTFIGTNGLGTVENWNTSSNAIGDSAMFVGYEDVAGGVAEDWLVTPQVTLGATNNQLNFYMKQEFPGSADEYGTVYEIRVSTTSQTLISSFTSVKTWVESDFPNTLYAFQSVDLSAYNGQPVYIAFVMTQDDGDSWFIDSVKVESPTCVAPSNTSTASITNNSGDATWTGNGSNYEIIYASAGVPVTSSLVTGTSFTIPGLMANANVSWIVREICGAGDTSLWTPLNSFTTTCTPNTGLPYTENFDTDTNSILPCGWVKENTNADNQEWGTTVSSTFAKSGTRSLFMEYNYDGLTAVNDWIVTPEFSLIGGQEYQVKISYKTDTSEYPENFAFYYGNGQASAGLTNLITNYNMVATNNLWKDTIMKFTPSTSGNFAIGVHATSAADMSYIALDDFELSMSPTTTINKTDNLNISVYPNPNNGIFSINNSSSENLIATVTDVQGKVVRTINNVNANTITKIDMGAIDKGMYIVTLFNGTISSKRKITIN